MARSPWLAPLAMLMVVVMFFTGCASSAPRGADDGKTVTSAQDGKVGGAQKARGGEAAVALFALLGIVIVGAVIVDLLILPATIPCHRPFCCTHQVVVVCCH